MNAPSRWQRCIVHHDGGVEKFVRDHFSDKSRKCLLVAGAGFDPRSATVAKMLSAATGGPDAARLRAVFIREHRPKPDDKLLARGNAHAKQLAELVPDAQVVDVPVLSPDDQAVVGGHRAVDALRDNGVSSLDDFTDVILDMSALSIGVSFPVARLLLEACEQKSSNIEFHVMVASHPQLDAAISSIPNDVVDPIRGFSGAIDLAESVDEPKIWLPHLATGRNSALQLIRDKLQGPVDVCPVLPISQCDPRASDRLIAEFESELYEDWEVDPRNLVYAIEDDPLDLYRTIVSIEQRRKSVFAQITRSHVILSPSGSKILAIGSLMAALEHDLPVRYVEAVSYEVDWAKVAEVDPASSRLVHVWLHGSPYATPSASSDKDAGRAPPAASS